MQRHKWLVGGVSWPATWYRGPCRKLTSTMKRTYRDQLCNLVASSLCFLVSCRDLVNWADNGTVVSWI
uniref:Uncharacterized protein n=1 Tax=Arundo donax TaxID=35708 RepID=A0A0A9C9W9_ARUDO